VTGGTADIDVTTSGPNCDWTAASGASWASVSPADGTGTGTVTVTVSENKTTANRSTTVTIGGKTYAVTQSKLVCAITISPDSGDFPAAGGTDTIDVTASSPYCTWTAAAEVPWILLSPADGTGSGTLKVTALLNSQGDDRSTVLTISGNAYAVTQAGDPQTWYRDEDGDGFGDPGSPITTTSKPIG
jgi:hypothetical protein